MTLQFNYLLDHGAFASRQDGTYEVDSNKIKKVVRDLTHDLLMIEARGDYAAAKKMLDELGVIRPPLARALERLKSIPVDIEPKFVTADELAREHQ